MIVIGTVKSTTERVYLVTDDGVLEKLEQGAGVNFDNPDGSYAFHSTVMGALATLKSILTPLEWEMYGR